MEKTVAYLKVIIHIANDMQRLVNEKCCSDGDAIQSRASSSVQLSGKLVVMDAISVIYS